VIVSNETVLDALPYAKTKPKKLDLQAYFATKGIEATKTQAKKRMDSFAES
jgi:hypothetical protein